MSPAKRIGIVGCGTYGTQILKCLSAQQRRGRVELVGLTDIAPHQRHSASATFDVPAFADAEQMMQSCVLDAVVVATPDHQHAPIIAAAAHHGLHVMTEKPLDIDSARAATLVETFAKAERILYVDQHKRFDPAHIRLREDIARGAFGRLLYGSVQMEDRIEVPEQWIRGWVEHSSPSWFLGVNFYDLVTWLTGLAPKRVFATGQKGTLASRGIRDTWDCIQVKVAYENGFTMDYALSWILPASFPSIVNQGIRIVGSEGIAEVDSQRRGYFSATTESPTSTEANPFAALEYDHPLLGPVTEGYIFHAINHFIDVLEAYENGETAKSLAGRYPDGVSALTAVRLAEAIDRSLASDEVEQV